MAVVLGVSSGFVVTAPTADPAGGNTTIDGSSVVAKDTSPVGAVKITEIGWYRGTGTNTANFEVALYSESGGVASARLFVDNTNSSAVQGWVVTTVDWAISESTAYWLAVQMDAHSGSSTIDSETSGGAGTDVLTSQTTLNDPYGGGAVADADGLYAIYAKVGIARDIQAGVGAATFTGFAPSVQLPQNFNADFGAATLAGLAPTVSISNNINLAADVGVLTISGFAPSVAASDNKNIVADVGVVTLSGFSPTIQLPRNFLADVGVLAFTGFATTIQTPISVSPGNGELTINGFSPALDNNINLSAGFGSLSIVGFAPSIQLPVNVNADTGVAGFTGFAPSIATPTNFNVEYAEVICIGFEPNISVAGGADVFAETGNIAVSGFAPTFYGYRIKDYLYNSTISISVYGGSQLSGSVNRNSSLLNAIWQSSGVTENIELISEL